MRKTWTHLNARVKRLRGRGLPPTTVKIFAECYYTHDYGNHGNLTSVYMTPGFGHRGIAYIIIFRRFSHVPYDYTYTNTHIRYVFRHERCKLYIYSATLRGLPSCGKISSVFSVIYIIYIGPLVMRRTRLLYVSVYRRPYSHVYYV